MPTKRPHPPTLPALVLAAALPTVVAAALIAGCVEPAAKVDPELLANHRAKLLLSDEPAGAQAVLDVREMFTGPIAEIHAETHDEGDADAGEVIEFTMDAVADNDDDATATTRAVATGPQQVVVVGQIGGMPNPWCDSEPAFPWKEGMATVFVIDPGTAADFAESEHAHEDSCDCPFCARHAADNVASVAVVNFLDDAGEVIDIRADQLLGVAKDETVVIRGTARLQGGEMLVIDADGVYVRR